MVHFAAVWFTAADLHMVCRQEEGSTELRAAIRAFNKMNQRIDSHIKDREMLFGAISHDLKTPIACLKLRADMLDNDEERERFSKIANDLDLMVKGALQCIKETDIHEEIESVDLTKLIEHIASGLDPHGNKISLHCLGETCISGKPLALKRALQNLIDNALKYGQQAHITLSSQEDHICIEVQDNGTSLRPEQLDKLCENSIIKAHGGHLSLSLTELGGLKATLLFPRETL